MSRASFHSSGASAYQCPTYHIIFVGAFQAKHSMCVIPSVAKNLYPMCRWLSLLDAPRNHRFLLKNPSNSLIGAGLNLKFCVFWMFRWIMHLHESNFFLVISTYLTYPEDLPSVPYQSRGNGAVRRHPKGYSSATITACGSPGKQPRVGPCRTLLVGGKCRRVGSRIFQKETRVYDQKMTSFASGLAVYNFKHIVIGWRWGVACGELVLGF